MNKKLYLLIAALAVLLIVTLCLIFALRPDAAPVQEATQPPVQAEETLPPDTQGADEPAAPDTADPLAGLTEEEMAALAMAEENQGDHSDPDADVPID